MHRHLLALAFTAGTIGSVAALIASPAQAQDGSQIMVHRDDSGATKVMHFSLPNLENLRTPDFTRKDLPLFTDKLVLSEPQTEAIGRQIDAYLQEFALVTKSFVETAGPEIEFNPAAEEEPAANRAGDKLAAAFGGPDRPGDALNFDDVEALLPPGTNMAINVGLTMGGGPGSDPADQRPPQADVQVSIDSPEGEDISQDVLDKIQERADAMAAQLMEKMQAQMEGRDIDGVVVPAKGIGPLDGDASVEQMQEKMAKTHEKFEEFAREKSKLRAKFVIDAQTNLAEEQVQRWPALERALLRDRSLPRGRISGESTDLVKVLAAQRLSDGELESLTPHVEAYETALDAALRQRDAFLEDASRHIDAAIAEDKPDKALSIAERSADMRVSVRNVNQQNAEQIAQALGDKCGQAFRADALKAFYPTVYRATRAQRMFESVAKMDGVANDLVASIADLRSAYESELAALNEQIRQTMDREEPKETKRGLQHLKQTMRGEETPGRHDPLEQDEDPIRAAMEKRADLDDRYLKTVASMLPPEQAEGLPKPRTHKGPIVIHGGGDA